MNSQQPLRDALRDLVIANRILANENVLDGFGHVSIRHPADPGRYFMARSRSPALVTLDDLIEYTLENEPLNAGGREQYAERCIHGSIYQARPDVMAVCHNHSYEVIPFGVTGMELRPILHMGSVIGRRVPIFDIREEFGDTTLLVTTKPMGDALARCLGSGRTALMRGHGCVVAGASLRQMVFISIYLQVNASLLLKSAPLGEIVYLSAGEVDAASELLLSPLSQNRAWEYWSARAGYPGV